MLAGALGGHQGVLRGYAPEGLVLKCLLYYLSAIRSGMIGMAWVRLIRQRGRGLVYVFGAYELRHAGTLRRLPRARGTLSAWWES
jgi:hypothetical protein